MTYSLTDKKELELRARDLPEGQLADMLMASAYFPAFRSEKLGGKRYTDGGVTDVLPLHVLVENGYKNIIAIRLFGPGIERNVRIPANTQVITIQPEAELGGTLEFEAEQSEQNMRVGYYDAMRVLYGLRGKKYYIDMDCPEDEARAVLARTALRVTEADGWTLRGIHEKLFPEMAERFGAEKGDYRDLLAVLLEAAAERIGLTEWEIYTGTGLLSAVGGEGALDRFVGVFAQSLLTPVVPEIVQPTAEKRPWTPDTPLRVCLLNDSFPPVVDGVANAVLNYARNLAGKEEYCVVATPAYPGAVDDYPFPVVRYPSLDTTKLAGYRAGNPFAPTVVEGAPGVRGEAQPENAHHGPGDPPAVHVVLGRLAGGRYQLLIKEPGRVAVELEQTPPVRGVLPLDLLGHGHVGPPREEGHRVLKPQVFDLHDEIDDAAALAAAETMIDLLVRRHGKGGGLLTVERTQAEQVRPALFRLLRGGRRTAPGRTEQHLRFSERSSSERKWPPELRRPAPRTRRRREAPKPPGRRPQPGTGRPIRSGAAPERPQKTHGGRKKYDAS